MMIKISLVETAGWGTPPMPAGGKDVVEDRRLGGEEVVEDMEEGEEGPTSKVRDILGVSTLSHRLPHYLGFVQDL